MNSIGLRTAAVGRDHPYTQQILAVAGLLFVLVLAASVAAETGSLPPFLGRRVLVCCVFTGALVAVVSAYRNSGLLVNWALVYAPLLGRLVATSWAVGRLEYTPTPLVGVFYGAGGWQLWTLSALLVGTLCFGVGVAVRWATDV